MAWDGYPTTLFKAVRLQNGKNVCIEADQLHATTKVVRSAGEYEHFVSQGWTDHPQQALDRLEAEQDQASTDAAVRAYDDQHMSEAAKAEAQVVEQASVQHIAEIPEGPKKRGRKPKGG